MNQKDNMNSHASMLLQIASSLIDTHHKVNQLEGNDFNIFSILDIETKEVDTHSKLLYELLNPNGRHHQGKIFLNHFLKHIMEEDFGEVREVKREDLTQQGRRIDFTISTSHYLIGIEMKIHAGDQENQLADYSAELQRRAGISGQTVKLYYLTLDGREATELSQGDAEVDTLSFADDILEWLIACIRMVALKPVIRESLQQYKYLIEKLTNQTEELDMTMTGLIGKDAENLVAAEQIAHNYHRAAARIEANVWQCLVERLQSLDCGQPNWMADDFVSILERCRSTSGEDGWFSLYYKIDKLDDSGRGYLWASFDNHVDNNYLNFFLFPADADGEKRGHCDFSKNEVTPITLQTFPYMEENHSWGNFARGCLDDNFKLRGNSNELAKWIGVTRHSEVIIELADKIHSQITQIKQMTGHLLIEENQAMTADPMPA